MKQIHAIAAGAALICAALVHAQAPAPAPQQPGAQEPGAQQPARGRGAAPDAQEPQRGQRGGRAGRGARGGRGAPQPTSFFVTSVGKGDGGNLGGLEGADAHCAMLAEAAAVPAAADRTWRAYLSAVAADGKPSVNARDRIGAGPWYNAKGVLIANNVADLHGDIERDRNQINKVNALTEKGEQVNGVGDSPNEHDILTGSNSHGRAVGGAADTTCSNWTSNDAAPDGAGPNAGPGANVGHHDRTGGGNTSWNFAHRSRGCSQENLVSTGGAGLFYCFGAN